MNFCNFKYIIDFGISVAAKDPESDVMVSAVHRHVSAQRCFGVQGKPTNAYDKYKNDYT